MAFLLGRLERNMVFPGSKSQGLPDAEVRLRPGDRLEHVVTPSGDRAAVAVRPTGSSASAVVFCYGNGSRLAIANVAFDWFSGGGRRAVAVPEYLGYGLSGGLPSEAGCYAAARAAVTLLGERFGLDPSRIVYAGWSLGAAVALDLAVEVPPAGLILFSPFTSLREMAATLVPSPIKGAARLFSRLGAARFDNLGKIPSVRCPVLIAHGRRDTIVPFAMGEHLAAKVPPDRLTFLPFESAGHDDLFEQGGRSFRAACDEFCQQATGGDEVRA